MPSADAFLAVVFGNPVDGLKSLSDAPKGRVGEGRRERVCVKVQMYMHTG